ncbi:unnamed protein product [Calypogeia fissa]
MELLREVFRLGGEDSLAAIGIRIKSQTMQLLFSLLAMGLVVGLFLLWVWLHRYRQRHHIGPKTWPIFGSYFEQVRNFERLHDWLLQYFHKGCLTFHVHKFWIKNTFTVDLNNVEYILKTNFVNYPKGARIRNQLTDLIGHGIFNVDGEMWKHQRKVASVEFSSSKLRDFSVHTFREQALKLVQVLSLASSRGQPVDMQNYFMRLTLDSICKVGFGVDIGYLTPELPALPFATAFDCANFLAVRRYIDLFWKIKRTLNIGTEAKLRSYLNVMDTFLYNMIDNRRREMQKDPNKEGRPDILSRFMSITDRETYSDAHLRDVLINFIIAGRDTTALTLSWLFYELCRNPNVVENIISELKTVLEETPTEKEEVTDLQSPGFGEKVVAFSERLTYQNLGKLHYLHAAVTEALRLYPAVPLETKEAAGDDTLPDGTQIKKGQLVSFNPYSMGRLKCIWGPDVMEFKPERWLKNGVFQTQSPFKLITFQAGPRICLGKDSAYLQMKMTTAILLRFFKFDLVPGDSPPRYALMLVLYIAKGIRLRVSPRS